MKREDVSRIFEGATKEQIDQLLDLNSADIGKAKAATAQLQSDLDAANLALTEAQNTIKGLESVKGNADELQKRIDAYEAAEQQRKDAEAAAAVRAEMDERMNAVLGDRKFIHEKLRSIAADEFIAAVNDKANRGKSDKDIFDALTQDKGYFASQNPPAENMGGINPQINQSETDKLSDADYYAKIFADRK